MRCLVSIIRALAVGAFLHQHAAAFVGHDLRRQTSSKRLERRHEHIYRSSLFVSQRLTYDGQLDPTGVEKSNSRIRHVRSYNLAGIIGTTEKKDIYIPFLSDGRLVAVTGETGSG